MAFIVIDADCTNAYAIALSPTQPTHVRINDAYYADWYRNRRGNADLKDGASNRTCIDRNTKQVNNHRVLFYCLIELGSDVDERSWG
jgi:hypothetical protein